MKSLLIRTGSVPVQYHSFVPGSPRLPLPSPRKTGSSSLSSFSLHFEVGRRCGSDYSPARGIRRAMSESDVIQLETDVFGGFSTPGALGSRPFSVSEAVGSFLDDEGPDQKYGGGDGPRSGIPVEELGFPGGGIGGGKISGDGGRGDYWTAGNFTGGGADRGDIGQCYEEMLRSSPSDSLLLTNYARFLHEVKGDKIKAEEYYGRAILANPGDGEVLSLYGKLIWETEKDGERARTYFDRALHASPDDCTVLGSYAHFLWEAEEEEGEEDGGGGEVGRETGLPAALVEAF